MLMSTAKRGGSRALKSFLESAGGSFYPEAGVGTSRTVASTQNIPDSFQKENRFLLQRRHTFSCTVRRPLSTIKSPKHEIDSSNSDGVSNAYSALNLAYISYERKDSDGKSPLVVQHGLFGCKENWKKVAKEVNFISKRSVFSLDARNHGESPHSSEMSLGLMAKDVQHFSNQLGMEKISFMGHSFGGRIGMMLAMTYPQILDKLIVVDTTPLMVQNSALRYSLILKATAVLKNMEPELRQCQGYNRGLVAEKAIEHILRDKRDIAVVLSNLVNTNGVSALTKNKEVTTNGVKMDPKSLWRVNLDSILSNPCLTDFPEFDESLAYKGKTLFVQGKKSQYIKESDEPKIKRLFPNAEFVWFEEAGHWLHVEKHNDFMKCILQFLQDKKTA